MPSIIVSHSHENNIILNIFALILNNKVIVSLFGGITMINSSFSQYLLTEGLLETICCDI